MTKRRKLSDLVNEETKQTELPESEVSNLAGLKVTESQTDKVTDSKSSKLTDLGTNQVSIPKSSKTTESRTDKLTSPESPKVTESQANKVTNLQTDKVTDLQTDEVPKYLALVRKEARLREEQLDNLTSLTRSLNRQRKGTGERITENTLIRVAVDLLLNQSGELKGCTEQELKESVGLE